MTAGSDTTRQASINTRSSRTFVRRTTARRGDVTKQDAPCCSLAAFAEAFVPVMTDSRSLSSGDELKLFAGLAIQPFVAAPSPSYRFRRWTTQVARSMAGFQPTRTRGDLIRLRRVHRRARRHRPGRSAHLAVSAQARTALFEESPCRWRRTRERAVHSRGRCCCRHPGGSRYDVAGCRPLVVRPPGQLQEPAHDHHD